jgi:hypothetical protein
MLQTPGYGLKMIKPSIPKGYPDLSIAPIEIDFLWTSYPIYPIIFYGLHL